MTACNESRAIHLLSNDQLSDYASAVTIGSTVGLQVVCSEDQLGPMVQQVLFSVVEDLGPYNAIVGRA